MIRIRRAKFVFFLAFLALACAADECEALPERILYLAPAATEMLFGLGQGDSVIGVTEYRIWPPDAKSKANVGSPAILSQWRRLRDLTAAREGNAAVIRGDFAFRAGPRYPLILESFVSAIYGGVREISR